MTLQLFSSGHVARCEAMHFLRSIFLTFTLLAQACPVTVVWGAKVEVKCPMSCCAENNMGCACLAKTDAPRLPAPANTPPGSGRELVPQVMVIPSLEGPPPAPVCRVESTAAKLVAHQGHHRCGLPRLTVLHCSFLI